MKTINLEEELRERVKFWRDRAVKAELRLPPKKCELCGDAGWISSVAPDGYSEAKRCECQRRPVAERMAARGVPTNEKDWSMAKLEAPHLEIAAAVVAAAKLGLDAIVMGRNGRGKTCLCVAALRALMLAGENTLYVFTGDWLREIQATYGRDHDDADPLARLVAPDVLYLDDLGGEEKATPWVRQQISHLLRARLANRKVTIITTNLNYSGLEDLYGSSVASRLRAYKKLVIPDDVPDLRRRSK